MEQENVGDRSKYKIKEIEDNATSFKVRVQHPDDETVDLFTFRKNDRWMEDIDHVEDGETKTKPRWLVRVEKLMKRRDKNKSETLVSQDAGLKEYEGDDLDI